MHSGWGEWVANPNSVTFHDRSVCVALHLLTHSHIGLLTGHTVTGATLGASATDIGANRAAHM